ncbi:MAG: hypothetical protein LBF61_12555 [Azoarcus sp.]|jgi:hypothetical protein|nr:hypothetical protein [Azoarcus sp.]
MINTHEVNIDGQPATQVCFHTGREISDWAIIDMPENLPVFPQINSFNMNKNFMACLCVSRLFYYCNFQLKMVYSSHKKIKYKFVGDAVPTDFGELAEYHAGIHSAINLIYKALFMISLLWQNDFLPKSNTDFLNLKDFVEKVSEVTPLPISQNSLELCNIISQINALFQSGTMFYGFNQIGEDFPTVLALDYNGAQGVIEHNHSLKQLVMGLNDLLAEISFFDKDLK